MVISQKPGLHRYDLISRRCLFNFDPTKDYGENWAEVEMDGPGLGNACIAICSPTGRILVTGLCVRPPPLVRIEA